MDRPFSQDSERQLRPSGRSPFRPVQRERQEPPGSGGQAQVASETREMVKTGKPNKSTNPEKLNVLRGSADDFANLRSDRLPPTGFEPVACALGKRRSILLSYEGNAESILNFEQEHLRS